MAKYNTFIVCICKSGRALLVTSSARKAVRMLEKGKRIEVWNENARLNTIHNKTKDKMVPYIKQEKDYLFVKQAAAEWRNKKQSSFLR